MTTANILNPFQRTAKSTLVWKRGACLALLLVGTVGLAQADDIKTAVGGGLGAAAGAVLGQSVGGKNGAILGGALGGATGAAVSTQGSGQGGAMVGGAVGGAAGAVVGQSVGGKTGAVVGAGAGGAAGATIGKNVGRTGPVTTSSPNRPGYVVQSQALDDPKKYKKHKKHGKKDRCDEDHPGHGHANGKYKHCD